MTDKLEKLTAEAGKSLDLEAKNIEQLKKLFPDIFREDKVDFDALKAVLGEHVEDKEERYNFTWHGKNKARQIAQTSSTGTLRPCKEESVNWESTQNLFIEGDNLEALKLLQKSYHQKVRMIYVDPPYNTGKDFVYKDNFQDNIKNYLQMTGQLDSSGNKVSSNSETSGSYHSSWLSMMYPRLKLARNLLTSDGSIFISIDDAEIHNLRMICNEIFGEDNFVAEMIWQSKSGGGHDEKNIVRENEYILVFAKNKAKVKFGRYEIDNDNYKLQDEFVKTRGKYLLNKLDRSMKPSHYSEALNYSIQAPDGSEIWPGSKASKLPDWNWRWSKTKYLWGLENKFLEIKKASNGKWAVYSKQYENVDHNNEPVDRNYPYRTVITSSVCNTTQGNKDIIRAFGSSVFDYSKPIALMHHLLGASGVSGNDIVLDLFSGSATTLCAVNEVNENKGDKLRFIGIQLPEETPQNSVARKKGYGKISEVSKDRLRKTDPEKKHGFKVFRLDSTNMKVWDTSDENVIDLLESNVDSVKTGRSEADILYEIIIKYGLDLCYRIVEHEVPEGIIYSIAFGSLIVCLVDQISIETAEAIGKLKQELDSESTRVVFKDSSFADDAVKVNAVQLLKQYGIDDVKSI